MAKGDTTSGGVPAKGSAWSDQEKVALLLSIIRTSGASPNWKNLPIPIGRTTGSTQKIYAQLIAQGAGITLVGGDAIPPPTPKKSRAAANGGARNANMGGKRPARKAGGANKGAFAGVEDAVDDEEITGSPAPKATRKRKASQKLDDSETEGEEGPKRVKKEDETNGNAGIDSDAEFADGAVFA